MTLALIAAVARNGAIGRDNQLLWRDGADQRHFHDVTMGCPVLMGRRTWESLPPRFRPLPGRRNVVISRDAAYRADGAEVASSLADALQRVAAAPRVCVIGGAQLYAQALPLADELVLTEIDADFRGDVFFPPWDRRQFAEADRRSGQGSDGTPYHFVTYHRQHA